MSSIDPTTKDKVISLFLDGMGPTQMFRQLIKDGLKISRANMNNIVYDYMNMLPGSIDNVDCTNLNTKQIDNLKEVIDGKLGIDVKIHRFEAMKEEVDKLKGSMAKLYPEQLYAPELELITNSIRYALDVGVPRYLIKKRFKNLNLNRISKNDVWFTKTKRVSGYKSSPPGVY